MTTTVLQLFSTESVSPSCFCEFVIVASTAPSFSREFHFPRALRRNMSAEEHTAHAEHGVADALDGMVADAAELAAAGEHPAPGESGPAGDAEEEGEVEAHRDADAGEEDAHLGAEEEGEDQAHRDSADAGEDEAQLGAEDDGLVAQEGGGGGEAAPEEDGEDEAHRDADAGEDEAQLGVEKGGEDEAHRGAADAGEDEAHRGVEKEGEDEAHRGAADAGEDEAQLGAEDDELAAQAGGGCEEEAAPEDRSDGPADGEAGEAGEAPPPHAETPPAPEEGSDGQAACAEGSQKDEEAGEEGQGGEAGAAIEKRESFPNQLEAMLNGMLATHNEKHPPFVADTEGAAEGSEGDAAAAGEPGVGGELQCDEAASAEARVSDSAELAHGEDEDEEAVAMSESQGNADAQEAAAVKIQALARGGKDRLYADQLRRDNAREHGPDGEDGAGAQDAERSGSRACTQQSTVDEGARSSDDDGMHFSDEEEDDEPAPAPGAAEATGEHSPPDAGAYPQQGEDAAVTKIQALARGKRDRQRVREMREDSGAGREELQDELGAPEEAAGSVASAPVQAPCADDNQQDTEDLDEDGAVAHARDAAGKEEEEEEEEEARPRLSFAKPIVLEPNADGEPGCGVEGGQEEQEEQGEQEEEDPAPRLSFAAPINVAAPPFRAQEEEEEEAPPPKLSFAAPAQKVKVAVASEEAPAVSANGGEEEDEYAGEEKVTFGEKPAQSLDVWMADCAGDETMEDDEDDDAEVQEEEQREEDHDHRSHASDADAEVEAEDRVPPPALETPVASGRVMHVSGAAAHRDSSPALPSPAAAASHSAIAGDRITQGLQTKLKAVEDKVQELQQQLLDHLSGGDDLDADEDGQEEAVAALNERVEKLIRMRAQIMLALEHQKTLTAARPPSSTRMGTASPRVQQDARALGYRQDAESVGGSSSRRHVRAGSNSPAEPAVSARVPPPMKLPKDLSLKPIRGTSKVPPAMFQRNKPPPPATKLFEKYPEEPRGVSRELAAPAPIGATYKPLKKSKQYVGGPRIDAPLKADAGSPRAAIDYDSYNAQRREEDVKVSFKVLSDQRGSNVANRSHGRAAAIAAQERELRFTKEQDVLKNLVRNQVSLENRYTKEAERAAKLQRINHGDKPSRHVGLFPAGASARGPF